MKIILRNELAKIEAPTVINVANQETVAPEPPKKKRRIFTFMDDDCESQMTQSSTTDHEKELQKYLEEPCEDENTYPLKYWKNHQSVNPSLANIATTVLGVSAFSACRRAVV